MDDGETPAYIAGAAGHCAALALLRGLGADLAAPKGNGATPLHAASDRGHVRVVRWAVDKKYSMSRCNSILFW